MKDLLIEMGKEYTYDGKPSIVLTVTRDDDHFPVVVEAYKGCLINFTNDGRRLKGGPVKLIEVKSKKWVNIYPLDYSCSHPLVNFYPLDYCCSYPSKEIADRQASSGRIACLSYTEGEGLETATTTAT